MSKGEQCGTIALVCLLFLVVAAPRTVTYIRMKTGNCDFGKMAEIKDKLLYNSKTGNKADGKILPSVTDTIFHFDPNTISYDDMLLLGLPSKMASRIEKYRAAGGKFRKTDDFHKIYGVNDSIFSRFRPYIRIHQKYKEQKAQKKPYNESWKKRETKETAAYTYKEKEMQIVELNTADSAQLVALYGIGPTFARRILTYRRQLGGFYEVEQLREVYNMPEDTYIKLYPNCIVDTTKIKKIDLNNFKYSDFKRHPYISVAQLNSIVNYKNVMKRFKSVDDLIKHHLVDTLTYEKIVPYLEAN